MESENERAYRLKVFFVGGVGVGKTSLIECLLNDSAKTADSNTETIGQYTWEPFKRDASMLDVLAPDELARAAHLQLNIWDLSGRPVLRSVHQALLTSGALFVVVFSLVDHTAATTVSSWVRGIQHACPGSVFLLVGTHVDKILSGARRQSRVDAVLREVQEADLREISLLKSYISDIKSQRKSNRTLTLITQVESQLIKRPKIVEEIICVSCLTSEGLRDFRRLFLQHCVDGDVFPILLKPKWSLFLTGALSEMKRAGHIFVTWQDFCFAAHKDNRLCDAEVLEEEVIYLEAVGALIDCKPSTGWEKGSRCICVNPEAFIHCCCLLNLDTNSKAFRFEGRRFWPKESGYKKPDPSVLVKCLEEIPNNGLLHEMLLPLLWQDYRMSDQQLHMLLRTAKQKGFLVQGMWRTLSDRLLLPSFPSLSGDKKLCNLLLDRLASTAPTLNWTITPFAGDVQIGFRFSFSPDVSYLSLTRILACFGTISAQWYSYCHWWQTGLLIHIGDCWTCVSLSDVSFLNVQCRVNGDDAGNLSGAFDLVWMYLTPILLALESLLVRQLSGLPYELLISAEGNGVWREGFASKEAIWLPFNSVFTKLYEYEVLRHDPTTDPAAPPWRLDIVFPFQKEKSKWECCKFTDWLRDRYEKQFAECISSLKKKEEDVMALNLLQNTQGVNKKPPNKRLDVRWATNLENNDAGEGSINSSISQDDPGGAAGANASPDGSVTSLPQQASSTILLSPEGNMMHVYRVASAFVASILAQSMAEVIATEVQDRHKAINRDPLVTAAQRELATIAASASSATHFGDIEGAAKAVIAASNAVHRVIKRRDQYHEPVNSKVCLML